MARFWVAYENDPTSPLFGTWGSIVGAIDGAQVLASRHGPPLVIVDREGSIIAGVERAKA